MNKQQFIERFTPTPLALHSVWAEHLLFEAILDGGDEIQVLVKNNRSKPMNYAALFTIPELLARGDEIIRLFYNGKNVFKKELETP